MPMPMPMPMPEGACLKVPGRETGKHMPEGAVGRETGKLRLKVPGRETGVDHLVLKYFCTE